MADPQEKQPQNNNTTQNNRNNNQNNTNKGPNNNNTRNNNNNRNNNNRPNQNKKPQNTGPSKKEMLKQRVPDFGSIKFPSPRPKVQYVDVGANLTDKRFANTVDQVIQRGFDAGVFPILITGTSERESREACDLTEKVPCLFSTVGVHPHVSKSCNNNTIDNLRQIIKTRKNIVAVGETGLDFFRNLSPPEVQEKWFEEQLKLAVEVQLPVFLHDREGGEAFYRILSKYKKDLKGALVHCFTGTEEEAKKYIELGCLIGLTGFVCGPAGNIVRDCLTKKIIPLDRLVIETDAPYQAPKNAKPRISTNEPCNIHYVAKTVAECLKMDEEDVAAQTTHNALVFFGLKEKQ